MIDWSRIDTVLLDMDGTLLDLNFDTYFWVEYVPKCFAEKNGISIKQAKAELYPRMHAVEGTMDWYCIDYWGRELDLDIALLKQEVDHLIAVHPHVTPFLDGVRGSGRRAVLVTNAHMKSLELKMEKTRLAGHLDHLVCSHDFGMPKEHPQFWDQLQSRESFDPARTLLIDDSLPVLRSAREYGIDWLLAVHKPDTRRPAKDVEEFDAIESFRDIMPDTVGT
ncbi:GMP/IMP nucleotidase [Thiohalomonas denitrificans]|uniref:Putative hydrolase of the HAD superfamily n=1 Tax=Thiohalomonas denitrificans TaxID=415747 RepID=A0A1G5QWK1_9GAMM|nr:GMP/IMP nucleotidase [Thiohalomonas denitrificans]SCZ66122.1 putative hydrolase of the HAD superfamily [Thiohalomonas denitrificans]